MLQLLGYIGAIIVLGGYFVSHKTKNMVIFDVSNIVGACILIPVNILTGTFFNAIIAFGFAYVAYLSLRQEKVEEDLNE